ncbi:MAG: tetratricopeptide repeat protein, partial [Planctomycetia bacterium]
MRTGRCTRNWCPLLGAAYALLALAAATTADSARAADAKPADPKAAEPETPKRFDPTRGQTNHAKRGFRTSLLPGEEAFEPFAPAKKPTDTDLDSLESEKAFVVGYMHLQRKDLQKALQVFRAGLKRDPASLPLLEELVPLCFRLEKPDEAMDYCRKALELDSDNVALLQLFGLRSAEIGRLDDAATALEKAKTTLAEADGDLGRYLEICDELAAVFEQKKDYAGMARTVRVILDELKKPHDAASGLSASERQRYDRQQVRYYAALAKALIEQNKGAEAVTTLQEGNEADGRSGRLLLPLAEARFKEGQYPEALADIEKYLKLQLPNETALNLYEQTLVKLGREKDLLPALEQSVAGNPQNVTIARYFAKKLLDAKQYKRAEEQLLKLSGDQPLKAANNPETMQLLARAYREMDEPGKLLETLAGSLMPNQFQDDQRKEVATAQIRAVSQDKSLVVKMAEAARKLTPDGKPPADRRNPAHFYSLYVMAHVAAQAKEVDLAKEFYERCLVEKPEISQLRLELIELLFKSERYADVVAAADRGIERMPSEFDFFEYKARSLAMQERTDDAVKVINDLIEKVPEREALVSAKLVLAWVYQHAKEWVKAVEVCEGVVNEFPNSRRMPFVRYMLSNIYTLKGDFAKAENQLLQLVEGDPETIFPSIQAAANNDLGYIWADEGKNLNRAEQMVRKALKIDPANAAYLDSAGWVMFKQGKYADAK